MSIVRYDPFRDLRTLQEEVNRLFSSNLTRGFGEEGIGRGAWNPSVDIYENTVTAFIGPSGCGKSTFIRCFNRMNDLIVGATGLLGGEICYLLRTRGSHVRSDYPGSDESLCRHLPIRLGVETDPIAARRPRAASAGR